jgi:hypothetical protein
MPCSLLQVEKYFASFNGVQDEAKNEATMKQAASKAGFFLNLHFQA